MTLTPTQEKIHAVATEHFLRDGFGKASLRKIVSEAGFTLGAFYGYYDSKEDLFEALVKETAEGLVATISHMGDVADGYSPEDRKQHMTEVFAMGLPTLLDYILEHYNETRLLLKCAEGTKYENFLGGLMDRNLASTTQVAGGVLPLNPIAARILVKGYYSMLGDAALSEGTREEKMQAMQDIEDMFAGGIIAVMKGR